jgi:hypothetical protein
MRIKKIIQVVREFNDYVSHEVRIVKAAEAVGNSFYNPIMIIFFKQTVGLLERVTSPSPLSAQDNTKTE